MWGCKNFSLDLKAVGLAKGGGAALLEDGDELVGQDRPRRC
jgi:hypothetical protein